MNEQSQSVHDRATKASIVIERTYRARVEDLWALWTTKEGFESWWGPEGFRVDVHVIEPRVGGTLRYDMIAADAASIAAMKQMGRATSHPASGKFTEIRPHRRLTIAQIVDFVPGVAPYESTISVDFVGGGESVRMVITVAPMHDGPLTQMTVMGLSSQLKKLSARFREEPFRAQ